MIYLEICGGYYRARTNFDWTEIVLYGINNDCFDPTCGDDLNVDKRLKGITKPNWVRKIRGENDVYSARTDKVIHQPIHWSTEDWEDELKRIKS